MDTAFMRWNDSPLPLAPGGTWAEIKRFYLGRPYWRTGISADLTVAVLQSIRDGKRTGIWLQVWEDAAPAIDSCGKWGFRETGHVPFLLGTEEQRDLLMRRVLTTS